MKVIIALVILVISGYFLFNQNNTSVVKNPYTFVAGGGIITSKVLYRDIIRDVPSTCDNVNTLEILGLTAEQCISNFYNNSNYCGNKLKKIIPGTIETVTEFNHFSDIIKECLLSTD